MKALILISVLLAGCAGAPPVTQRVEIPVFTPCVKVVPARPDYEFGRLGLDASDGAKVLALARDWPRAMRYGGDLEAVIAGCR
ncbi:MAG: hypothetical protein V4724_26435 [Pseudomonadota bacterium]